MPSPRAQFSRQRSHVARAGVLLTDTCLDKEREEVKEKAGLAVEVYQDNNPFRKSGDCWDVI